MKSLSRLLLSAAIALTSYAAAAADISGTWTASFDTQVGTQNYTYEFQVKGDMLTGRAKSANGDVAIEDGKIDGDMVSFVEKITYQGMDLTFKYSGKIVSDDEIDFKREVVGIATEELVAKRKE